MNIKDTQDLASTLKETTVKTASKCALCVLGLCTTVIHEIYRRRVRKVVMKEVEFEIERRGKETGQSPCCPALGFISRQLHGLPGLK